MFFLYPTGSGCAPSPKDADRTEPRQLRLLIDDLSKPMSTKQIDTQVGHLDTITPTE